jgi:hypothetical protein
VPQPSAIERFASARDLKFRRETSVDGAMHEYVYSHDMARRYAYSLTWEPSKQMVLWVMLNPGTGETEQRRRNTLERCKLWSREWGYGGLFIGNVFATRTKSAKELVGQIAEADPANESALRLLRAAAAETIVAWGSNGRRQNRAEALAPLLKGAWCLGFTARGEPRHPLYVPRNTSRIRWFNREQQSPSA